MWKVKLVCDSCGAAVAGESMHYRHAAYVAKQAARTAGWLKAAEKESPEWACAKCLAPTIKAGDSLTYIGSALTPEGVTLRGKSVAVISPYSGKLIVKFKSTDAGRYYTDAHWFCAEDFQAAEA